MVMEYRPDLMGPVWCHTCFHVGRLLRFDSSGSIEPTTDERYFGRGIGTALCRASVQWAKEHGYVAVVGLAAPEGLVEFARWSGHLPWTTYAKSGFRECPRPVPGSGYLRGEIHEPIASEIKNALRTRPVKELLERAMVLDLQNAEPASGADG